MSYLIGVPIPLNSIGKIPLSVLHLENEADQAVIFKHNVLQIVEQVKVKCKGLKANTMFFKEYSQLTMVKIDMLLASIDKHIYDGHFDEAVRKSNRLIDDSLDALDYYNKYFTIYLGACICSTYTLWIVYLLTYGNSVCLANRFRLNSFTLTMITLVSAFSYCQGFPITYYLYSVLPVVVLHQILLKHTAAVHLLRSLYNAEKIIEIVCLIVGIELILISFFYRFCLSVILAFYFVLFLAKFYRSTDNMKWLIILSPLTLSVFPLLPVLSGHLNIHLVYSAFFITNVTFLLVICANRYYIRRLPSAIMVSMFSF